MSFKLEPTKNNPNLIEFKKESKQQKESEDKIEILKPIKREPFYNNNNYTFDYSVLNNERIKQLELENKSLISKINDLNEILQVKSNEIIDLKLKLSKYETDQNDDQTSKNNKIILNLKSDLNYDMSFCESDTDSDQSDDETNNKVININFRFDF